MRAELKMFDGTLRKAKPRPYWGGTMWVKAGLWTRALVRLGLREVTQ